ncbi:MAG: hypothetical protein LAP21_06345 [Acidobacteriia bacterium]|nr:hypothetical protein [Terriglobia bacterium]
MPGKNSGNRSVFLNFPYDEQFGRLCLAYICGVACFGLVPRATLEIPGNRRLDRIIALIQSCPFSLHDLSRVQLDRVKPRTPRFNMPFELGLAIARDKLSAGEHSWYVFEAMNRRAEKSLSDISGTDVYIHGGTVRGVLRQLSNAFIREERQPSLEEMYGVYRYVRKELASILRASGSESIFDGARPFRDVCLAASLKAEARV